MKSTQDFGLLLHKHHLFPENSFAIRTDHQTDGRGQQQNRWDSAPQEGLSLSLSLKKLQISSKNVFIIHQLTTLALINALQELTESLSFRIKWPNDIYLNDKKLAGILVQNSLNAKLIHASLIGIGLNITQMKFPGLPNATSLKKEGLATPNTGKMTNTIIQKIEKYFNTPESSFDKFFSNYQDLLWKRNQEIQIRVADQIETVILKAVTLDGKLEVSTRQGLKTFSYEQAKWINK